MSSLSVAAIWIGDTELHEKKLAQVVGSTPTRSISFILVNYGIELSLFWEVVGQNISQERTKISEHIVLGLLYDYSTEKTQECG